MSKQYSQSNNIYAHESDMFASYPNKYNLTKAEYALLIRTFSYLLIKSCVDEGKVYTLPAKLGRVGVVKINNQGRKILDYNYFKKTGEIAYIKNLHSGGYIAKFHWFQDWPKFDIGDASMANVFRVKLARDSARYLSKSIKLNNTISKYYDY